MFDASGPLHGFVGRRDPQLRSDSQTSDLTPLEPRGERLDRSWSAPMRGPGCQLIGRQNIKQRFHRLANLPASFRFGLAAAVQYCTVQYNERLVGTTTTLASSLHLPSAAACSLREVLV